MSAFYTTLHTGKGVVVRTRSRAAAFAGAARLDAVVCEDGARVAADLAVVGVGVTPNVELAAAAGLPCDDGIVVDEYARTDAPDVYAAGDCTNHPNAVLGRRLRLESVPNAMEQARVAAANLAAADGKARPYATVPWFWSDQYDCKLQMVGFAADGEQSVTRGDPTSGSFRHVSLARLGVGCRGRGEQPARVHGRSTTGGTQGGHAAVGGSASRCARRVPIRGVTFLGGGMKLGVGIVVTALALFVFGFLYWGANPLPYATWSDPPDSATAKAAVSEHFPSTGVYGVPRPGEAPDGVWAMIYVRHDMPQSLPDPGEMLKGFAHYLLVAGALALVLRRRGELGATVRRAAVLGRCGRGGCGGHGRGLVGLSLGLEALGRRLPCAALRAWRAGAGMVPARTPRRDRQRPGFRWRRRLNRFTSEREECEVRRRA